MDCTHCHTALPVRARFCPTCGVQMKLLEEPPFEESLGQTADGGHGLDSRPPPAQQDHEALKAMLIDCYVNFSMSQELSEWLQELGLPSTGTMQEKLVRLRQQANSLMLPAESLPRQTIWHLNQYAEDVLAEICQELGIDNTGPKDRLITRIYHTVGMREGWLQPLSEDARHVITETFLPIMRSIDHKNDYDLAQWGELGNILSKGHGASTSAPRKGYKSAFMGFNSRLSQQADRTASA